MSAVFTDWPMARYLL